MKQKKNKRNNLSISNSNECSVSNQDLDFKHHALTRTVYCIVFYCVCVCKYLQYVYFIINVHMCVCMFVGYSVF